MARTRLGVGGSIWVGGVLCIAGHLRPWPRPCPGFVRYNGEDGMARKKAADEAWAATPPLPTQRGLAIVIPAPRNQPAADPARLSAALGPGPRAAVLIWDSIGGRRG